MSASLYVVATPIGNLSDISLRAKDTLAQVDAILCEDTRVTAKLLAVLEIQKPLVTFHQHSDDVRVDMVLERLRNGESLALVTDAGTPGISDPGGKLVQAVAAQLPDVQIVPIPGPSAVIAALSVSGFPSDRFVFLGFPPHKKGRNTYFSSLAEREETIVFYESTHRIEKTLAELGACIGNRLIMVGRELTKLHETLYRGTTAEVTEQLKTTSMRGEFVIVVQAQRQSSST